MDRRRNNRTDESTASVLSITDSLKSLVLDNWRATMYFLGDAELSQSKPEYILHRMLSTRSYISTHSSLAEDYQRARDDPNQRAFFQIGKGQCGTIYALKGRMTVIKLPNSSEKKDDLFRDAQMHELVERAFSNVHSALRFDINVPKFHAWVVPTTAEFWNTAATQFDQGVVDVPDYGLVSDRIFPLPSPVREAIVDALCPKSVKARKAEFLKKAENKDCLVRLYVGRRDVDKNKIDPTNFKLRNFPLHVDEMEYLKLDTEAYVKVMAQALAVMHWKAGVDANDVEFVLGSAPEFSKTPLHEGIQNETPDTAGRLYHANFENRSIGIWLLDFDHCKTFDQNPDGLKQLVNGFWWNDPYYPRPNSTNPKDKELWRSFSQRYLDVSVELTESKMPKLFIEGVEEQGRKRSAGNTLFG